MSKIHTIKVNEKLPRGSFFYVKVGDFFYAGESAEVHERELRTKFQWGDRFTYFIRCRSKRYLRDIRKGTEAAYRKTRKEAAPAKIKEFTGRTTPKLVDDKVNSKKYRTKLQAEKACERLNLVYRGLGIKITIELEGDIK